MTELRQLKHLLTVAETGSFTKASRLLAISQPALSASISKLEDEFQVKLLDRGRDRVCPTAQGLQLLEKASQILRISQSLQIEMKSASRMRPLSIGVERTISNRPVAEFILDFQTQVDGAQVELIDGVDDDLRKRFLDGELDALISSRAGGGDGEETLVLFHERLAAAVPSGHPLARKADLRLCDLDREPLIRCLGCDMLRTMYGQLASRGVAPTFIYTTDQSDRALALVASGVGVAILPELQGAPGVTTVALGDVQETRSVVLTSKPRTSHPLLGRLVDCASAHDWRRAPSFQIKQPLPGRHRASGLRLLANP